MKTEEEYARVAYEAYGEYTHWLTYNDKPMPKWEDLPERVRNAWAAAARAISKLTLDEMEEDE